MLGLGEPAAVGYGLICEQGATGMKQQLKATIQRLMKPGMAETHAKIDAIEHLLRARSGGEVAVWRGGLLDGRAVNADGSEDPALTPKYRDELNFWVGVARDPKQLADAGGYQTAFGTWQRQRLVELGQFVGLEDTDEARTAWCAQQSVVEIGAGPYPSVAEARWRRTVAVDPIAEGYVVEDLLPTHAHADEVTYIAAAGENIPLPAGFADLVIIENCLDHVSDPPRVMGEMRRLLRPGGFMWLLVDLMDYSDHMHPHSFSEDKLRALIASCGYEVVKDRKSDHKSHPQAYGEYRALLRKPALIPAGDSVAEPKPAAQAVAQSV